MSIEAINWVFKQDDLHNSGAKFVLTVLANYADEHGKCYPSQETLAAKTSMTDRSVRNHLEWLEEYGYITGLNRQKGNQFTSNLYQLEFAKEKKESVPMSRKKKDGAENISDQKTDGAENISVEDSEDSGRKTFPNGAENISYNTSALKEDTKGGGNAVQNGSGKPPAAAASPKIDSAESFDDFLIRSQFDFSELDVPKLLGEFKKVFLAGNSPPGLPAEAFRPDFAKFLVQKNYLRQKQIEFPQFNVAAIWQDFTEKCGSPKYPKLRPTTRQFDKWLAEQDEEFEVASCAAPVMEINEDDFFAKKYGGKN